MGRGRRKEADLIRWMIGPVAHFSARSETEMCLLSIGLARISCC